MARKTMGNTPQMSAVLDREQLQMGIARINKRIIDAQVFDPQLIASSVDASSLTQPLIASIDDALARTFGSDTIDYQRYRAATYFDWPVNLYDETPLSEIRSSLVQSKTRALGLLREAVRSLEERLAEFDFCASPGTVPSRRLVDSGSRKIFVVHGHDTGTRESVARFLERAQFEPIILHEQANQGRTVIEKFEKHADVGFVVVLLTPDDIGSAASKEPQKRARQNVILELGYFIGRLGREKVCALRRGDLELPSDILGVIWTDFDAHGAWKSALAKELFAAGYSVDWNKVMSA